MTQRLQFSATTGAFSIASRQRDRVSGNWTTVSRPLPAPFRAVADLKNLETGLIRFRGGFDARMVLVRDLETGAARMPAPLGADCLRGEYSEGFRLPLHVDGVGPLEWLSTTWACRVAVTEAYRAADAAGWPRGLVPFIEFLGHEDRKAELGPGHSPYCVPLLAISGWAGRPAALPSRMPAAA